MNLNNILIAVKNGTHSLDDYNQLMQLIGYSVCGYAELSDADQDIVNASWETMEAAYAAEQSSFPPLTPAIPNAAPSPEEVKDMFDDIKNTLTNDWDDLRDQVVAMHTKDF